ncbi:MAG: hypothetical protein HXM14_02780 [Fusobacterium periodonticum]|nr:hypothetical protein [Fusobacterium periodonticum]
MKEAIRITSTKEFEEISREKIQEYYKKEGIELDKDNDIFVVWLAKVLDNTKGVFITNKMDKKLYEITYNGQKNEIYLDAYIKEQNILIKNDEF